jgi:hypothetical protein
MFRKEHLWFTSSFFFFLFSFQLVFTAFRIFEMFVFTSHWRVKWFFTVIRFHFLESCSVVFTLYSFKGTTCFMLSWVSDSFCSSFHSLLLCWILLQHLMITWTDHLRFMDSVWLDFLLEHFWVLEVEFSWLLNLSKLYIDNLKISI